MRDAARKTFSVKKLAWVVWIGSALQFYDFYIYATAAALVIGPLYFPTSEPGMASVGALISVGAGYFCRPLGAFVLGYVGDQYGRRLVLSATMLMMGISTLAIGCLPSYQQIGITAPILLVGLRLLQGFAVSGVHAGFSTLMIEISAENERGFLSSFTLSGTQVGGILSSAVFIIFSELLSETDFISWGWRVPFLLSGILVVFALWVRLKLPESPSFLYEKYKKSDRFVSLRLLWHKHKFTVIRVILAAQLSVVSTIYSVFSLSWAVNYRHLPKTSMLALLMSSTLVGMAVIPVWARLSDRVGRRPVFLFGVLGSGVLIWPYMWAISQSNVTHVFISGILLSGIVYSAANGVWPSLYGEMFNTNVRFSGMALGTQIGFTLAGQAPAFASYLTHESPEEWYPVALLVSICCSISAMAVFYARETNRISAAELGN